MMEFDHTEEDLEGLPRVIILAGPTGVGKTALSLALAESLNAEIVGADSLQVYRGLDVGTAKVSAEERARVPHHLIDVVEPTEEFTVADYRRLAGAAIQEIHSRGKAALLVGGTGLYLRLLVHGFFEGPEPDEEIRGRLMAVIEAEGAPALHRRLQEVDPELAEKLHPNDQVRIIRGLEVAEQTGTPLSEHQRQHRFRRPEYHALKLVLIRPREELYDRINRRVDVMVESGLEDEVRSLLERGIGPEVKPMQSLGYKQMVEVLGDGRDRDEAIDEIKRRTRRYAKRQISWFRGEPGARWVMAPVLRGGAVPPAVVDDLKAFLGGGKPRLEWAEVDPYNVQR